jgi:hypothetical protein
MLAPPRARQNGNVVLPASRAKAAKPAAQGFSESGLVSSPIPQVPAIASQVDYPRKIGSEPQSAAVPQQLPADRVFTLRATGTPPAGANSQGRPESQSQERKCHGLRDRLRGHSHLPVRCLKP